MALRDLSAFLEDDGLEYPLPAASFSDATKFPDGKKYVVPSPDARTGLWLTALADLSISAFTGTEITAGGKDRLHLDDDEERSLYQRVLGPVYDEMLADGVKWTALQAVGQDAYLCFAMGEQAADGVLAVGRGEAPARANRATRRAAKKTAGRRSPRASTGTASRTPRPASTGSSTSPNARKAQTG